MCWRPPRNLQETIETRGPSETMEMGLTQTLEIDPTQTIEIEPREPEHLEYLTPMMLLYMVEQEGQQQPAPSAASPQPSHQPPSIDLADFTTLADHTGVSVSDIHRNPSLEHAAAASS